MFGKLVFVNGEGEYKGGLVTKIDPLLYSCAVRPQELSDKNTCTEYELDLAVALQNSLHF
jgi:hypothetical protein